MDQQFVFSRHRLSDFLACQRRFQLRYIKQLAWPAAPIEDHAAAARQLGEQFHRLLHHHFLGLAPGEEIKRQPTLRRWWEIFQQEGPAIPLGERYPELGLTAPIGRHLLTGRFDLLVMSDEAAHLFDWKTEARPRSEAALREDLQTRLYLALITEGAPALGRPLEPERVSLTYWYVNDPARSVTITYNQAAHQRAWDWLESVTAQIMELAAGDQRLPLTDDWQECARCLYQVYCGRQAAGFDPDWPGWDEEETETPAAAAPDLP